MRQTTYGTLMNIANIAVGIGAFCIAVAMLGSIYWIIRIFGWRILLSIALIIAGIGLMMAGISIGGKLAMMQDSDRARGGK